MTTQTEALKLALEELENCADLLKVFEAPVDSCIGAAMLGAENAVTAIKEALAQPEQEPVAFLYQTSFYQPDKDDGMRLSFNIGTAEVNAMPDTIKPLFPHPPVPTPQPEQEPVAYCDIHHLPEPCVQCAKEHEGYNIPPQPKETEQEPVAWWIPKAEQFCLPSSDGTRPFAKAWEPLYTAPPKRKPLTDKQIDNATRKQVDALLDHMYEYGTAAEGIDFRVRAIARAIEAAHGIKE